MGMLFHVQSSKFGPSYLQSRIENFLEGVPEILVRIPYLHMLGFLMQLNKLWLSTVVNLFCVSEYLFLFPFLRMDLMRRALSSTRTH
jgi:hypothetical protein